ncbi:MAG: penicillin acylase family protein, partial [Pseudomonadales bacterium]|nr:penicillin acylase family protein [Pseudomonadales bacterium]
RSCSVLAAWDRRAANSSRGVHVWREFWRRAQGVDSLYRIPFSSEDPANTPRGINVADAGVRAALGKALAEAQTALDALGLPLDAPLSEVQYERRNGEHIPIPGGEGWAGMWSVIVTRPGQEGYTPIIHGNSYIQVVGWNEDGTVNPRAVLTYSQSEDPASPHFADLTKLYSAGRMLEMPFYEADIQADPNLVQMTISE